MTEPVGIFICEVILINITTFSYLTKTLLESKLIIKIRFSTLQFRSKVHLQSFSLDLMCFCSDVTDWLWKAHLTIRPMKFLVRKYLIGFIHLLYLGHLYIIRVNLYCADSHIIHSLKGLSHRPKWYTHSMCHIQPCMSV